MLKSSINWIFWLKSVQVYCNTGTYLGLISGGVFKLFYIALANMLIFIFRAILWKLIHRICFNIKLTENVHNNKSRSLSYDIYSKNMLDMFWTVIVYLSNDILILCCIFSYNFVCLLKNSSDEKSILRLYLGSTQ